MYETLKEWKLNLNVPAFLKMHVCVEPMKKITHNIPTRYAAIE
jgi:hypothetical protein